MKRNYNLSDNVLVIDTEVTTSNKGNPYDSQNFLVCYSWWFEGVADAAKDSLETRDYLRNILARNPLLVLFNAKFDLAWLRRVGLLGDCNSFPRIYDTQLAEFVLSDQRSRYPSLEEAAVRYELGHKYDVVKEEYWKKGINTDQIPWEEVLKPYAVQDALLTYQVYLAQQERWRDPLQRRLFSLQCQDIPILLEMEWNGLKWDAENAVKRQQELEQEQAKLLADLGAIYPGIPINFGSTDQLSAFLYGGVVKEEIVEHIGFFKTGERAGQPKTRKGIVEHTLPQLFKPLKGSEMKKEGVFSTSEDTLLKLKGSKQKKMIIEKLLRLAAVDKLLSGYFKGIPKLYNEMNWEDNILHGQLNQVVAQTGRLSATKPNQQNMAPEAQDYIVTRF